MMENDFFFSFLLWQEEAKKKADEDNELAKEIGRRKEIEHKSYEGKIVRLDLFMLEVSVFY